MIRKIKPLIFVIFVLISAACLGEEAKKAEMTLDTKFAEVTGGLDITEVSASEFMDMYVGGEDFVLIDVRTAREFDSGHIPGAVHIPYTELDKRIGELGISKDKRIVVYCEAGVRSKKGANSLLQEGYTDIVDITDGMGGWRTIGGEIIVPGMEVKPPKDDEAAGLSAVIITPEQLSKGIDSYKVIFLGTPNQYAEGHVPDAILVDPFKDISDKNNPVENMVLNKADYEALMSRLGLSSDDSIVLYDAQSDRKFSARFYWILKYYNHEKVSLLDGGLSSWRAFGGELSTSSSIVQESEYLVSEVNDEHIATLEYVNQNLDNPDTVLVEATTRDEYENDGHIPGAVLVEVEETLNADGTIKDESKLLSIYTSKGITRDKEVITYCHTGNRGATLWFELKYLLKYPNVRLYDGSLEEWNSLGMPLEKGIPTTTITTSTTTTTTEWVPSTTIKSTSKQSYLEVEPTLTLEGLEGTKTINLDIGASIKIDDAYIYLTGGFDGCVGWVWWYFNIYGDTPEGAVWEGTPPMFLNEEVQAPMDISSDIHYVSDALDDYKIVVTKWDEQEGLTVKITH